MKSKFYCAECGKEVKGNADSCPHCGTAFGAVRCPQCSFEGKLGLFRTGCPACGFKTDGDGQKSEVIKEHTGINATKRKGTSLSFRIAVVMGLLLIVIIFLLVYILFKP